MARLEEMWLDDKHQDTSVDLTAIYAAKGVPPHQCRLELLDCGSNPSRANTPEDDPAHANTLEDVRFEDLVDFLAHDSRAIHAMVAFQEACEQQEAQLRAKTLPN
ncbi:predicted protein [Postia placenta Mad-698-R]|uniref:Uncharacterized protein n=1 Tax=Postia placenta MAD-698-R-SB12 TaxID=670580 RepID=A0A1X6NAX0_9APHY|nr:hypothetical protein POSPLADRAFT_1134028 [Postia placenta MAD-698-R-SB12]EED78925.1 predicted protein [Postia placenta Mad-698-R]OSX65670.1 hypothetical protein POSPLADRAFT_1134028 [Postia placenta MAD-698-R-SB12]